MSLVLTFYLFSNTFAFQQTTTFFFVDDQTLTWANAQATCGSDFNTHLARIDNTDQNEELRDFQQRTWVAGTDQTTEGTWCCT